MEYTVGAGMVVVNSDMLMEKSVPPMEAIFKEIEAGFISVQKHPRFDLWIYNYTHKTQWERHWNDATMNCRGLILDANHNYVSRPFPKFFNYEELTSIPVEKFSVYEKMDGMLGVLYQVDGVPYLATRGSFTSEFAEYATTNILHKKYSHVKFNPDLTYLFEIIYPGNRIVLNYHGIEDIFLLAIIDTKTGRDLPLEDIGVPLVKRYEFSSLPDLFVEQDKDREGYVVLFESGFRLKVKFDEYKRIHRIVTRVNTKTIYDLLASGGSIDSIIDNVPDEFYEFVTKTARDFLERFAQIEDLCKQNASEVRGIPRRDVYRRVLTFKYPHIIFRMIDGKDYREEIWNLLR